METIHCKKFFWCFLDPAIPDRASYYLCHPWLSMVRPSGGFVCSEDSLPRRRLIWTYPRNSHASFCGAADETDWVIIEHAVVKHSGYSSGFESRPAIGPDDSRPGPADAQWRSPVFSANGIPTPQPHGAHRDRVGAEVLKHSAYATSSTKKGSGRSQVESKKPDH